MPAELDIIQVVKTNDLFARNAAGRPKIDRYGSRVSGGPGDRTPECSEEQKGFFIQFFSVTATEPIKAVKAAVEVPEPRFIRTIARPRANGLGLGTKIKPAYATGIGLREFGRTSWSPRSFCRRPITRFVEIRPGARARKVLCRIYGEREAHRNKRRAACRVACDSSCSLPGDQVHKIYVTATGKSLLSVRPMFSAAPAGDKSSDQPECNSGN